MAKLTLPDIGSLANTESARQAINDNFTAIEDAVENTLSRDGTTPNQMSADFDMNGNSILNVADPISDLDAVNKRSVEELVNTFAEDIVSQAVLGSIEVVEVASASVGQDTILLPSSPGTVNNVEVYIDGLALTAQTDYHLSGTSLNTVVLVTPLSGGEKILVRYTEVLATGITDGTAVTFTAAGTGGTIRTLADKALEAPSEADYAVIGDGVANDSPALLNAANAAVLAGRTLSLDGTKTYAIDTQLNLPSGLSLQTNGATFKDLTGTASNTPLIVVNGPCLIDEINVVIPAGLQRDRAVVVTGNNPQIAGAINVTSTSQQANTSDNSDAAVRFSLATSPCFGSVNVINYDRAVQINGCSDVDGGPLMVESYTTALWCTDLNTGRIRGAHLHTASPNATYTPGHVGVLLSCDTAGQSRNITLEDFVIEDSGEHGIRIGGPEQQDNISIVRPRIKNVGGSGIKILGTDSGTPTDRNKRIFITDPIIEDCGTGGLTSNMCGILAMFCDDVHITNPIIRKQDKLQSGHTGVRLVACGDVHITEPEVADATFDGIWIDGDLADISRVSINGGISRNNGRDGLRATAGTSTFRRFNVNGLAADGNTGIGLNIAIGGGSLTDSLFRMKVHNNTGGAAACDNTAAILNIQGSVGATPLSGITAGEGSTFRDVGGLTYHVIGTDWIGRGRVRLGAAVVNNNGIANTMQDVTGLSFPVKVGSVYRFRFVIPYSAAATTTGSRWSITGPVTLYLNYRSEYSLTATTRTVNDGLGGAYDAPAASNTDSASLSRNFAIIEGIINPNANGTLQARFASEVAGSAITASAHAYVDYEEVIA